MNTPLNPLTQKNYRNLFWWCLSGLTLLRLAISGSFGLGVDESHYLMYSRHLSWGYFDHPPMVAFLAALTQLMGDSLFFVRLGPIVCSTLGFIILRRLALSLYEDEQIAFWSFIVLNLMPFQQLLTVALLPDATLNLFWGGTLLAFWAAIKKDRLSLWVTAGILFGLGLLSKYHAILLPACLFLFFISSQKHRFRLIKPAPWIALTFGFLVFLPNILWNAKNEWVSYKFQLAHGGKGNFAVDKIFEVLGGQIGAWSPLIFGLLVVTFVTLLRQKESSSADRFVVWTSLPVFAFFCGIGTTGKILPHWPAVGWFTGSIALSALVLKKIHQPNKKTGLLWKRWSVAAGLIGLIMTLVLYIGMYFPFINPLYNKTRNISLTLNQWLPIIKPMKPFKPQYDIMNELYGWDEIGKEVEAIKKAMPRPEKTFVFSHRFFTMSQLAVSLQPDTIPTTLGRRMDQYHLWFSPEEYIGWDALLIDEDRYAAGPDHYLSLFDKGERRPFSFTVQRKGWIAHEIKIYKYYGFKGEFEK